jgi:glutathione S-transferase
MDAIRLFTFSPGFGLPTTGPFSLKLAMALRMAEIPYELEATIDFARSPKGKIPWIVVGDTTMADSALILSWLGETRGVDLEAGLSPIQRAHGLALRVLLEEHWHQVFEIELILDPEGAGAGLAPLQERFKRHLYERGMLRHTRDEITAFGKADLDAAAALLADRPWAVADHPTLTDCSVFGMLAPAIYAPFATRCMAYARTLRPLVAFVERARAAYFPELAPSSPALALAMAASTKTST